MGGFIQATATVAGGVMLLVLLYAHSPLAYVPTTALAAVVLVSVMGLFDLSDLRLLYRMSYRAFLMSVATTLGVLTLGVLPEVLHEWRELPLRMEERDRVPKPREDEGPTLPDQPPDT